MEIENKKNTWFYRAHQYFLASFLFLLPWQTIWITQEQFLNGVKWQYGTLGFFATEILLWGSIISFMICFIKEKILKTGSLHANFTFSKDRIFIFSVLLFIVYAFASLLWSPDRLLAEQQALHIMEAFLLFFILVGSFLDFKKLAQYFIAGAILQSIFGIYQFLTQSTFVFKWLGLVSHPVAEAGTSVIVGDTFGRVMRSYGSFSHPNVFGGYLVVSIILTVLLYLKEPVKSTFGKIFQMSILGIQVAALFFTFSRSAWIVTGLFFCGIFLFSVKNKFIYKTQILKLSLFVGILSIFLTVTYWPLVYVRVARGSSHEIQSVDERIFGYREGFQIWKTSPLFGVGAGNYTRVLYQQNPNRPGWEYQPVHNVPLLFLAEFGIVACILFLGIIVSFWRFALQNSLQKYRSIFFVAIFFILSLFDHYFYSSYTGLLLFGIFFAAIFHFSLQRD